MNQERSLSPAQVRALAERYTAAWCSQNAASVASCYAAEGSLRVNDDPPAVGRSAITEVARGFIAALPDIKVIMDELEFPMGRILYRWTLIGTNTGPGGGGRRVRIRGFEEWRLDPDGLIAESKGHFDSADYKRQLTGAPR